MKMRLLAFFMAMILCFSCLALVACDDGNSKESGDGESTPAETPAVTFISCCTPDMLVT